LLLLLSAGKMGESSLDIQAKIVVLKGYVDFILRHFSVCLLIKRFASMSPKISPNFPNCCEG